MPLYKMHNVLFSTTFPLFLPTAAGEPRLFLHEGFEPYSLEEWTLLGTSPREELTPLMVQAAYRKESADILLFTDGAQILVKDHEICYLHSQQETVRPDLRDGRLLGSGFAWWFLRQGHLPLHAGAMMIEGEAVLFAAQSGTGKSSLICSLLKQGYPLLCDDFVAVTLSAEGQPLAASAYPYMRLWPNVVEQVLKKAPETFPTVFAGGSKRRVAVSDVGGRFLEGSYPISRIYLLQRESEEFASVHRELLVGHEAFMTLLSTVLLGHLYPLGELQTLLPTLQQLVTTTTVVRLRYPSGWHWLPTVHRALVEPVHLGEFDA